MTILGLRKIFNCEEKFDLLGKCNLERMQGVHRWILWLPVLLIHPFIWLILGIYYTDMTYDMNGLRTIILQ